MNSKNALSASSISELFRRRELTNTAKWIDFANVSQMKHLDFFSNLADALSTLRNEIACYKREYYDNPSFKQKSFDLMLDTVLSCMRAAGRKKFHKLTTDLIPIAIRNLEASKMLLDIADFTKDLKGKQRFYMLAFCYQISFEAYFKDVLKTLLAMKRLTEGKSVNVSGVLEIMSDEKIELFYDDVAPDDFKKDIHRNLRNSIAHANFIYLEKEGRMQFWDINPKKNEISMKPIKLNYKEFSRYEAQILIFSEIYGFITLLLIAFDNIRSEITKSSPTRNNK